MDKQTSGWKHLLKHGPVVSPGERGRGLHFHQFVSCSHTVAICLFAILYCSTLSSMFKIDNSFMLLNSI